VDSIKYRCPSCGFQIFNRRFPKCESCGATLPSELLFTPEEIAALDAEHEKSRREREARARKAKRGRADYGGEGFGGSWDSGGDGDGGGGD
jgi:DNA-directed RNA polymerase subunit RPC12/RpoP